MLAECARGRTVDRCRNVMSRSIAAAQRPTPVALMPMRTGVPSADSEIDTTAERNFIVNDHDLLVMDRAGRMGAVDGEVHSLAADLIHKRHRGEPEPDAVECGKEAQIGFE